MPKNLKEKIMFQIDELEEVIESILFVAGDGIDFKDIAEKLELKESVVKSAVESLKTRLSNTGVNIITFKNKAQLCSNPKYAEEIANVLNPIKEKQLTKAALETVAVIAYKQPVTRLEIEEIRGVNSCDYAIQLLLDFKMIEVVGRKDAIGKPLLFGTTEEFLKRFEINSIEDLPDYDSLLERIKLIHQDDDKEDDSLYNNFKINPEEPDEEDKTVESDGGDMKTLEEDIDDFDEYEEDIDDEDDDDDDEDEDDDEDDDEEEDEDDEEDIDDFE